MKTTEEHEEKKTEQLVELAMIFYQGAEAPDAEEWDLLFTYVAERNINALREYVKEHGLDVGEVE